MSETRAPLSFVTESRYSPASSRTTVHDTELPEATWVALPTTAPVTTVEDVLIASV